jgi:hypothetical protein
MAGVGGSSGLAMQALEYPTVAFVFALTLAGYSVWDLDQLPGRRTGLASAGMSLAPACVPAMAGAESAESPGAVLSGPPTSGDAATTSAPGAVGAVPDGPSGGGPGVRVPAIARTTAGCRVVMGVTMAFRLVMMF